MREQVQEYSDGLNVVFREVNDEEDGTGICSLCGGQCLDPEHDGGGRTLDEQMICEICDTDSYS